jgi:hypothetical protein
MTTTNDGGPVHPMVMKAARAMAEHEGEKYGPSAWELYSHAYLAMAQAALTECGALDCLAALEASHDPENFTDGTAERMAESAIAKVYGSAPE